VDVSKVTARGHDFAMTSLSHRFRRWTQIRKRKQRGKTSLFCNRLNLDLRVSVKSVAHLLADSELAGFEGSLRSIADVKFAENICDVVLYGPFCDE
jgi:hypothetical protein